MIQPLHIFHWFFQALDFLKTREEFWNQLQLGSSISVPAVDAKSKNQRSKKRWFENVHKWCHNLGYIIIKLIFKDLTKNMVIFWKNKNIQKLCQVNFFSKIIANPVICFSMYLFIKLGWHHLALKRGYEYLLIIESQLIFIMQAVLISERHLYTAIRARKLSFCRRN